MASKPGGPLVLVVDDESNLRRVLSAEIAAMGYRVKQAADGASALEAAAADEPAVVVLDLQLPDMTGLDVLARLKERSPLTEVILLTGHGSVETAIAAMRAGAYDYQQKPCHLAELEQLIGKALEKRGLVERSQSLTHLSSRAAIEWGEGEALARVRSDLAKVAPTDASVLILGESGTGKELVARELHAQSAVAGGPFVVVNCGAIPPSLVESTLFGHEKGAFTGAERRKLGLAEVADGGTLFLDEVGDLPLDAQVKLLRFLQFGEVLRVGATHPIQVQVRVIAATHVDIDAAIAEGEFREDLLYRLETVRLELPPLRERRQDIPLLIERFQAELVTLGRPRKRFTAEALAALAAHPWPGNVRELRTVVERLAILAEGEEIGVDQVTARLGRRPAPAGELPLLPIKELERRLIVLALHRFSGDKPAAAQALGIALKTLYNKIKAYEVDVDAAVAGASA